MTQELVVVSSLPFSNVEMREVLAGRLAASSIRMYTRDVNAYARYTYENGLDPLNPQSLMTWRDYLAGHTKMSPNTINRMLAAVKQSASGEGWKVAVVFREGPNIVGAWGQREPL